LVPVELPDGCPELWLQLPFVPPPLGLAGGNGGGGDVAAGGEDGGYGGTDTAPYWASLDDEGLPMMAVWFSWMPYDLSADAEPDDYAHPAPPALSETKVVPAAASARDRVREGSLAAGVCGGGGRPALARSLNDRERDGDAGAVLGRFVLREGRRMRQ
jgi:hypothetical protein